MAAEILDHRMIFPTFLTEAVTEVVQSLYAVPVPAPNVEEVFGLEGVFSTIYLKGDVVGKLSFFIRGSGAANLVGAMLGESDMDEASPEILDGVGEILNMVIGCFKKRLAAHKLNVEISIPSTRLTGIIPPSRWENNVEQVFGCDKFFFKFILSYRIATKEDKAAQEPPPKPKLTAAELLKMAMARKK